MRKREKNSKLFTQELKKTIPIYILGMILHVIVLYLLLLIAKSTGSVLDMLLNANANKEEIMKEVYTLVFYSAIIFIPNTLKRYCYFTVSRKSDTKIRKGVFKHTQFIKETYYEKLEKGRFLAYLSKEILMIRKFLGNFFQAIIDLAITPVLVIIMSANSLNPNLALIIAIILPISICIIYMLYKQKKKQVEESRKQYLEMSKLIEQNTSNFTLIKLYNNQDEQKLKFEKHNKQMATKDYIIGKTDVKIDVVVNITIAICYILGMCYGVYLLQKGQITVGDITVYISYLSAIFSKFQASIRKITDGLAYLKQAINRINQIMSEEIYITEGKEKIEKIDSIEVRKLNFKYNENQKEILKNINLQINKNEKIGIIGLFGSGKTTLMNAITGFYEVADNKIFINGKDINKINKYSIFGNINYILQKDVLINDTIKNNITLEKEYEGKQIIKASNKACVLEDIFKMDNEFEEKVGEKGLRLSGGQKQRIVIARNIIANRDFVILDDVLSALDNVTEKTILQNIVNSKDKTAIIISNKITNMENLDKVYIMIDGEITDSGKHTQLLEKNQIYKQMYEYEMKGENIIE